MTAPGSHPRTLSGTAVMCLLLAGLAPLTLPALADTAKANTLLQSGQADAAAAMLTAQLKIDPDDAKAHQLLCRVFYSEEFIDRAVGECEHAVALDSTSSDDQLWLGRAYGLRASHVNLILAFTLAKRVRAAFEQAVQLDPRNASAMHDLGEFYLNAPAIVGGGTDKALALADRMPSADALRLRALVAEKAGDLKTAEAELKDAVNATLATNTTATANKPPAAYVDLAMFYQRHDRNDDAEAALKQAIHADHAQDAALVDVADILTSIRRSPALARELLRQYLASPAKSEAAPAFKVEVQLAELLKTDGDLTGARHHLQTALALAAQYAPAQRALQDL